MSVTSRVFDRMPDGREVYEYTITNPSGMSVKLLTYGATVNSLVVRTLAGFADVVLGFDTVGERIEKSAYQGETVGRYANRISGAKFTLSGTEYRVTANEGGVKCLHGGGEFSHALWAAEAVGDDAVRMTYSSPDGAEGFPGNMTVSVLFTLTDGNSLAIDYAAVSDKQTVINLTNHSYFNLGGYDSGDVLDHILSIDADRFTPTDSASIPTGEMRPVEGTPFDFRAPKPIGRDIHDPLEQLSQCRGYDHNFCLNSRPESAPAVVAECPRTGVVLEAFTDMPGVQLYCGNFLAGESGKGGAPMIAHAGFCLETQFYPDSPNRPEFPSCVFAAGEEFRSRTEYKFSLKK